MCAFSQISLQQTITTTTRHTKMAQATSYSFEAKIASHRYRIYKNAACRSSRPEMLCKKGALKSFAKFTGKHLC